MEQLVGPLQKGLSKSASLLWLLTRVIIPVSCLVTLMEYYGVMEVIARLFSPLMALAGLPGEAAVALTLGFLVNYYAAVGAIVGISLSVAELTTLAVMLGISHELPVETVICSHTGLKIPFTVALRISTALVVGMVFNLFIITAGGLC